MEIVHSAMVVAGTSPPVEAETEEIGNAEPGAENQLPSIGTEADAPPSLQGQEEPENSG